MPKKAKITAKELVNSILDREIITIDFESMPTELRREWGNEAKLAINNRCIQHLIGKTKDISTGEISRRCIENIARYSDSQDETDRIRHIMIGAELVRELLEEMLYAESDSTHEDLNAAV